MAKPSHVYVVVWNGDLNELEWPAAIAFSQADADAIVSNAPERPARYSIDTWPLKSFLASTGFAVFADQVRSRISAGDLSPIVLREANFRRSSG